MSFDAWCLCQSFTFRQRLDAMEQRIQHRRIASQASTSRTALFRDVLARIRQFEARYRS